MILSWNRGFRQVEVETDSIVAKKKILEMVQQFEVHGQLIRDIQDLMNRSWTCRVVHSFREANTCADAMAKQGSVHGLIIYDDPPVSIASLLLADSLGVSQLRVM
ncbi:hypothetical protein REPUB_Repub13aG0143800 [Reevesia pubescens]